MDKDTKKKLASYFIIIIFGFSTFAYFASYTNHSPSSTPDLDDFFLVEGPIDRNVEIGLLNYGITLVKIYYNDESYKSITDNLAESTSSYTGSYQVSIQNIESDENYVVIENYQNSERFNSTKNNIINDVCKFILFETPGCVVSEN